MFFFIAYHYKHKSVQWPHDALGAPAMPEGDVMGGGGCQIIIKMWDNFARLALATAHLAKVPVWFN